jgi:type II secretory pathway pseudopilin PulG
LSGLTLVELLIAATMMSILFLGLATHLRGGITVWQRVTDTAEALQRQRLGLDWLERDLANIFEYEDARDTLPPPEFTRERLAFVTLQPTGYKQFARVRFVRYECAEHDGLKGLWRVSLTIGEARAGREVAPTLTLPGCDEWSLRYAYLASSTQAASEPKPLEWHDEWKLDQKLPRLIQVSFKLSGQTMLRIFAIPAGALEPFPT